jgi:thioredoxin domain-containing protein 5
MMPSSPFPLLFLCLLWTTTAKQLTKASYKTLVHGEDGEGPSKHLFVNFHSPRCPLCLNLEPVWNLLEILVNSQPASSQLTIGSVDCSEENELCNKEGIKGFPTLKIFRAGDPVGTEYEGPRDLSSLIELLFKQLKVEIKARQTHKNISPDDDSDIGFGEDSVEDTIRGIEADRVLNREDIRNEIEQGINGMYELTDENYKDFLAKGRHFVKFFAPWCGHCQRLEPTWFKLAESFKHDRSVSISRVNCDDFAEVCTGYGIKGYPSLLWIVDGKVLEKYTGERKHESLKAFVNSKVEEDKKSNKEVRNEDLIVILTETNFKKATSSGVSFVTFTAPWCTHCKKLEPIIEDLAVKVLPLSKHSRITIAKVDCSQFDSLCTQEMVDGYPTMILYKDGVNYKEYDGERSLNDIYEFVSSFVPADKDEL